jgi:hypothetical protein
MLTLRRVRRLTLRAGRIDVRPGNWAAVGLVGSALAIDVVLIRRGEDPISTCVRTSRIGKAATALLAAHLVATIPNDPLTAIADRITRVPRS